MSEKRRYTYEAMFLLSQATAADFGGAIAHINEVMQRGHATVLAMKKWDERRLAYEIKGQKRGVYILAYFSAPYDMLSHIERDCNLSEKIMRSLILRADHLTAEEIAAQDDRKGLELEAKMRAERPAQPAAAAAAPEAAAPAEAPQA
jgi:small subunit ribosomal protein S6